MVSKKYGACGEWLFICATVLALAGCGGGTLATNNTTPTAAAPVVFGFTPKTAVAGVATTFAVSGVNLTLTPSVVLDGGSCDTPTNTSTTGFTVICTPGSSVGAKIVTVNTKTLASGGWWMGTDTLTVSASPVVTGLSQLTDTGITTNQCYAAGSDVLVSCTSAAAIALNDKQDGMIGRDVTSTDSTDGLLGASYTAIGTDCIKDNLTSLVWQRASSTLTQLPGNSENTEAQSFASTANTIALCGFSSGWRVPTRQELQSLLNYGASNSIFAVDMNWFSQTRSASYLSSTQFVSGSSANVWVVDFTHGAILGVGGRQGRSEIRLVR